MRLLVSFVLVATALATIPGSLSAQQGVSDWPRGYANCMKYGGIKKKYRQNCTNIHWTLVRSAKGGPHVKVHRAYATYLSDKQKAKAAKAAGLPKGKSPFGGSSRLEGLRTSKNKVLVPTVFARVVPLSDELSLVEKGDRTWWLYRHKTGQMTAPPDYSRMSWHVRNNEGLPVTTILERNIQKDGTRDYVVLGPNAEEAAVIRGVIGPATVNWRDKGPNTFRVANTMRDYLLVNRRDPQSGEVVSVAMAYDGSWSKEMPKASYFKAVHQWGRYSYQRYTRTRSLIEVGPAPEVMGPAANKLYWFASENDAGVLSKPDHVLGVVPLLDSSDSDPRVSGYILVFNNPEGQLRYWVVGDKGQGDVRELVDSLFKPRYGNNAFKPVGGVYVTETDIVYKPLIRNPEGLWYAYKRNENRGAGTAGVLYPNDPKTYVPRGKTPIDAIADFPFALAKRKDFNARQAAYYASPEMVAKRESLRKFNEDLARRNWERQEQQRNGVSAPTFGDLVREWQGEMNRKALTQRWRCTQVQPGIEKCSYY